jgi:hypothetical protein
VIGVSRPSVTPLDTRGLPPAGWWRAKSTQDRAG